VGARSAELHSRTLLCCQDFSPHRRISSAYFFQPGPHCVSKEHSLLKMGKKRKSHSSSLASAALKRDEQTKYNINENFADSEDEFFAGRDQILLQDGPSNKRRKVHVDGRRSRISISIHDTAESFQTNSCNPQTKKY
jgi:hypothetical protein